MCCAKRFQIKRDMARADHGSVLHADRTEGVFRGGGMSKHPPFPWFPGSNVV